MLHAHGFRGPRHITPRNFRYSYAFGLKNILINLLPPKLCAVSPKRRCASNHIVYFFCRFSVSHIETAINVNVNSAATFYIIEI